MFAKKQPGQLRERLSQVSMQCLLCFLFKEWLHTICSSSVSESCFCWLSQNVGPSFICGANTSWLDSWAPKLMPDPVTWSTDVFGCTVLWVPTAVRLAANATAVGLLHLPTLIFFCTTLQLQRDVKIDKLSQDSYVEQTLEILAALRKLGDTLRPDEDAFLARHATDSLRLFEKVDQEQLGMFDALWFPQCYDTAGWACGH